MVKKDRDNEKGLRVVSTNFESLKPEEAKENRIKREFVGRTVDFRAKLKRFLRRRQNV